MVEKFGSGLINDTYLCEFRDRSDAQKFILQRINASVFKQPGQVMENIETVTGHIEHKLRAGGARDPYRLTPALLHTRDNASHYRGPSGSFWRVFHYIEAGEVFDTIRDQKHAYEVGRGLGRFQALVSDLPPRQLHDTLPGFHHTACYVEAFDRAMAGDARGRAAGAGPETEFVDRRRPVAPLITDLMREKAVPLRVVHNDPKVNNIMIGRETHEALCMLDLDTVKPGTVLFDFGDCVRSAANCAGEDGALDSVRIDMAVFESVTRGYLREAGVFLTKEETNNLALSVKVIAFELGLRFLADYVNGDMYFKTGYPDHNLHRARVQFRLVESIEAAGEKMQSIVERFAGEYCR